VPPYYGHEPTITQYSVNLDFGSTRLEQFGRVSFVSLDKNIERERERSEREREPPAPWLEDPEPVAIGESDGVGME
jgi:hypothetical protein